MFENLELILFKNKITKQELAELTGIRYNSLLAKLNGKQPLKLDEAMKIREIFSEYTIEYLFSTDDKTA